MGYMAVLLGARIIKASCINSKKKQKVTHKPLLFMVECVLPFNRRQKGAGKTLHYFELLEQHASIWQTCG